MPRALFSHLKYPLGRIYLPCFQSQCPHCSFNQGGVSASRKNISNVKIILITYLIQIKQ